MVQSDLDILLKEFFKDTIASQCKLISRVCQKRKLRQTCNQLYQMKCSTLFCMSKTEYSPNRCIFDTFDEGL